MTHARGGEPGVARLSGSKLRRCHSERGSTAIFVAISLVLVLTATAFAVDLGSAWAEKRRLHTATDAAALAAAREYALGGDGCASVAGSYLQQNDGGASLSGCAFHIPATGSGYVTVNATSTVTYTFAGVFGVNNSDAHSSTTAMYGSPKGGIGLRPMGLCTQATPALSAWLNLPVGPSGPSATLRIPYAKSDPQACGSSAPGNWGMLTLDGGSNSTATINDWIQNGYQRLVNLSPPPIAGNTGAFAQTNAGALDTQLNKAFPLPLWDSVSGTGSNAQFHIVGFVTVTLIGYKATGAEAQRYLDLQFVSGTLDGPCCAQGGLNTGTFAVAECAVTPNFDPAKCSPS
jgi:Flp pilus assembly protein TadG